MSDTTQLTVHGYDVTVDFSYTPGTEDSLEQPGDPEELAINAWWFDDEQQAKEFAESEGLNLEELLGSEWFTESIFQDLWDFVRNPDNYDDYERYEDDSDYLYDTDDLDW